MTPVDQASSVAAVRMMKLVLELVQVDDSQAGVSRIPRELQATA
jgi:hypothetical protein